MPYYLLLAVTCIAILLAVRVYKYKKKNEHLDALYLNMRRRINRILQEAQQIAQLRGGQVSGLSVYEALSDIVQGYEPNSIKDKHSIGPSLRPGIAEYKDGTTVVITHIVRDESTYEYYAHVEDRGLVSIHMLRNVV